jgi:uncharacterized protein
MMTRENVDTSIPDWLPQELAGIYRFAEKKMAMTADDAGHQWDHVLRVTRTALLLAGLEGADVLVVGAAALLHDVGRGEAGDHAQRSCQLAAPVLSQMGMTRQQQELTLAAIDEHCYSKGVVPASLEGKILQDADRLDAIGAIGIARCFGKRGSPRRRLYHPDDPFFESDRPLQDDRYALDHFYAKLLYLQDGLHTESARKMAAHRHAFLHAFLKQLRRELNEEAKR